MTTVNVSVVHIKTFLTNFEILSILKDKYSKLFKIELIYKNVQFLSLKVKFRFTRL